MKLLKSIIFILLVLFSVLFLAKVNAEETNFGITSHEMKVYKTDCLSAYTTTMGDIDGEELFPKLYDIPSNVCKEQRVMDVRPGNIYVIRFKIENTEKNNKDGIMILYANSDEGLYPFTYQLFRLTGDDPFCYLIFDAGYARPENNGMIIIGVQLRNANNVISEEYMIKLPIFKEQDI
jgi:hypothetical protein